MSIELDLNKSKIRIAIKLIKDKESVEENVCGYASILVIYNVYELYI